VGSGNLIQTLDNKSDVNQNTNPGASQSTNSGSQGSPNESNAQTVQPATTPELPQIAGTQTKNMEVTLSGNFASLQKFLANLQNFPRFVNVSSIDIAAKDEAGTLETKMEIYIYFRSNTQ
jgi:hypothetical protein